MAKKPTGGGGGAGGGGSQLDAKPFFEFVKKLAKDTGAAFGEVMEHETLKALQMSARRVGRTSVSKAGGKFNPTSTHFKGWVRMNGKFYYVGPTANGKKGFRYSNSMWAQLMKRLAANRKRAETRVALSKAIFYAVSAQLKLKRYSVGWDESSRITKPYSSAGGMGKPGRSGPIWTRTFKARKYLKGDKKKISIDISSRNTFNPFTKGAGKVQAAFNGRAKYYERAVLKNWRKRSAALAAAYPELDVKA